MTFPRVILVLVLAGACATKPVPRTTLDTEPARIVSAFFGLDNQMPQIARLICFSAPGKDGMPVTFSRRIAGAIDPKAFSIRTVSGAIHHPVCATLKPADAQAKRHTVLLIGDLGDAVSDPPQTLEITGDLKLEGAVDARGYSAKITPLAAGPSLALAMQFRAGAIASDCPTTTQQVVVAVWTGGVKPREQFDASHHLAGYELKTASGSIKPFALGDISDRDNYVHLCLGNSEAAHELRFAAGILADPNGDLNPQTSVAVSPQQ